MPRIPEDELERIKRQTDLAALVRAKGIELSPHGQGHLAGKCPFHDDSTPSFIVTPGKNLFHCLGCGAGGSVIDFIIKHDGLSFRHAVEVLRAGQASALVAGSSPTKKGTIPKLPPPVAFDADDRTLMRQVMDYYQERLQQTPAALEYLRRRGVGSAEAIATFQIGFADRTLGLRLPTKQRVAGAEIRERLTKLGVYRETGHEHLNGCVVFPLLDVSGEIAGLYGRKIIEQQTPGLQKHLYLPGPRRGLWNAAALQSREVILCEAVIDALTFWEHGFKNVTTAYGTKGFSEELEDALVAAKVERVFLAFDRDEPGEMGAEKVAARLMARGVECRRVLFPHGQDANEYARKVQPAAKSLAVLLGAAAWMGKGKVSAEVSAPRAPSSLAAKAAKELAAPLPPVAPATPAPVPATPATIVAPGPSLPAEAAKEKISDGAAVVVSAEGDEGVLRFGDREWLARGLLKNAGLETLKVTLRLSSPEGLHVDQVDLMRDQERRRFIERAAEETRLHADLLRRELGRVLLALEAAQGERLKAQAAPAAAAAAPEMPPQEKAAALALLRAPNLLDRILADFAACGVVGEETNKLVGYLAVVSRKLDNPLAVIVQSTSAAGKTALMEAVLSFVPPEERVKYSALTGQALYYLGDADLRHKILAIVEEEGAEKASYALKLLQSEGELTIASTGKDPHTGRMVTQEYRVEGPVMIFLTTTAVDIDEELLNRCLVLTVDEGREQTAAIHRLQRERETLAGLLRKEAKNEILATHRAAQRLLRPLSVVNPFAEQLTFLDDRTRTRRDHTKYLALIRCIALLHQHQREIKTAERAGRTIEYIEATLGDIAAANRLAHEVLGRCLDEMPPQTRRLLALLEKMVAAACGTKKMERPDVLFRARQLREYTGWGNSQLQLHLSRLVALEYVLAHRADHGQGFVYELVYDGGGKDGRRFLPGLLDVEKLQKAHAYDGKHPGKKPDHLGVNGDHPALIRPVSGGLPAPFRAKKNGVSSSEAAPRAPQMSENAHLEQAALAVS
jgi:DNA primase catalytic core